jgi:hypothetical protein
VEQQPTREELAAARERGRADAEERARAGGEDVPGTTNPLPYAPESLQAAYEDAYDARFAELDGD